MYLTVPESLSGQVVMILVNLTGTVQFFFSPLQTLSSLGGRKQGALGSDLFESQLHPSLAVCPCMWVIMFSEPQLSHL